MFLHKISRLPPMVAAHRLAAVLMAATVAGCATYRPEPLPEQAESASSLQQLHGYHAGGQPLDTVAVEQLVLLNNPDLRSAQARHVQAQAQRVQDSVLPNPVVSGSAGYLTGGVGDATAWTASISEDITALITLRPRRVAAKARADAVDASLLWEQWQTLGKARLLVIDLIEQQRLIALQRQAVQALEYRQSQLQAAVADGNMERLGSAADLAAAADARSSLNDLERRQLDSEQQLHALLGLKLEVALPLVDWLPAPALDAVAIRSEAGSIRQRRPDLVALQLGYQAQEASLRAAVLAQFPPLSFGYAASQDNSRVRNGGPAVTFALPLFDRNQGNIALARATREQLHVEYGARLASAQDEVDDLLAQYAQLQQQRRALAPAMNEAAQAARQAGHAAQAQLLDVRAHTDLEFAALNRRIADVSIEQAMLEQQAALELLVGQGMPTSLQQDVFAP
ncbi:TolC family protein [Dyella sp. C9]|uniref:TolC family protein n=1 Tax=Dyella sp. C9 TaxID=2202154 RepID=UPI0013008590|nr:TolC family protein [Dyella sp. C9]